MRDKIIATDGHILTDGEIYGTEIYLGDGIDANSFYEITMETYQAMFEINLEEIQETIEDKDEMEE